MKPLFSPEQLRAIADDPRSARELSQLYKCSTDIIYKIKRKDYAMFHSNSRMNKEAEIRIKSKAEIQREIEYILKEVDKMQVSVEEKESAVDKIYGKPKVV